MDVPEELKGLELYEKDRVLCARWQSFLLSARKAYPGVDLSAEVARAHTWELAQPPASRKKNRVRFLMNWFSRAKPTHTPPAMREVKADKVDPETRRVVSRDEIRRRFQHRGGDE